MKLISKNKLINVIPCKIPFTYPIYGEREESLDVEVDGIIIEELTADQPEIDFDSFWSVVDGKVVGNYPYLKVAAISQKIEKCGGLWLKSTTHIPII